MKCPLQVRYLLKISNRYVIRCKLNAPILFSEPGQPQYWEYDGFLRTRDNNIFWTFEKREALGSDFFYFITSEGRIHGYGDNARLTLSGAYLTTGQDMRRSIEHSDVLLQKLLPKDLEHQSEMSFDGQDELIKRWMHSSADILKSNSHSDYNKTEHHDVESLWKEFQQYAESGDGMSRSAEHLSV